MFWLYSTSAASSSFFFLLSGMRSSSQLNSLLVKKQSISFLMNTKANTCEFDSLNVSSACSMCYFGRIKTDRNWFGKEELLSQDETHPQSYAPEQILWLHYFSYLQ